MDLSDQDRAYYARKFREQLDREDRNEVRIQAEIYQSFYEVLRNIVYRVAPHLWDRMRETWENIFYRWLRGHE